MSAHIVYDTAPLGALIRYSDGTLKPPARFAKKLAAWERRNGLGLLVRKEPPRDRPTYCAPVSIILNEGNFAAGSVILVTVMREHRLDSNLRYVIVERPSIGMVRVLLPVADNLELLHLADSREIAELWLAKHRHAHARITAYGLFHEIISWKLRMFVPVDAAGIAVLDRVLGRWPVERVSERESA